MIGKTVLKCLLWLSFITKTAYSFVLLSGPAKARLPVSVEDPYADFYWDGSYVTFTEEQKKTFTYLSLSDYDFMKSLILYAMEVWNDVPETSIKLRLVNRTDVETNARDELNIIAVKKDSNLTSSAFALPIVKGHTIIDCDITLGEKSSGPTSLTYALVHELGHCLGLGHSHANKDAIMGYSNSKREIKLGADDIAGLLYLYPKNGKIQPSCGSVVPLDAKKPKNNFLFLMFFICPLIVFFHKILA